MSSKTKHDNDILSSEEEEEEDNELSNFDLSMISIAGHSEHDCGYCKQKDTSVSFGIWAHSLTCTVKSISLLFFFKVCVCMLKSHYTINRTIKT